MKLAHLGMISTAAIIVIGFLIVAPAYLHIPHQSAEPSFMLFFNVVSEVNALEWCRNVASILERNNINATVFVTGKIAEMYPECVTSFEDNVDIGSQTYNYVNLTSLSDYLQQLEEVQRGKQAVDDAGQLSSRLFRAPYGATDANIYSLLNRTGIVADFSYLHQYNVYRNGQFIKLNLTVYNGLEHSTDFFLSLKSQYPVVISFDDSAPTTLINQILSVLQNANIHFVSASELTGIHLTIRGNLQN